MDATRSHNPCDNAACSSASSRLASSKAAACGGTGGFSIGPGIHRLSFKRSRIHRLSRLFKMML